jgi:5'-3' exonuclease
MADVARSAMSDPLLVVDAPSLLFRAFYALPDSITDGEGRPVNALLGTTNLILLELERRPARAVVLCFGEEAATYRTELYEPYHADREPPPDALDGQFAAAPNFFDALGWTTLVAADVEPDDVLGSLARIETEAGGKTLILTGDRDMFQCASDSVTVLYLRSGSRGADVVDPDEVRKRYGVSPELVPDFIALRGDPSDGLPGGKGIGEKTAADLLHRHGSLEGALAGWTGETPRVRAALHDQADELRSFRHMATLQPVAVERPEDRPTDFESGAGAAEGLGMRRLAERLRGLTS